MTSWSWDYATSAGFCTQGLCLIVQMFSASTYGRDILQEHLVIWLCFSLLLLPSKIKDDLIWYMKRTLVLKQLFVIFCRPIWEGKGIVLTVVGCWLVCSVIFSSILKVLKTRTWMHLFHRIRLFSFSGDMPKKNRTFLFIINILLLLCFISTTKQSMMYLERA